MAFQYSVLLGVNTLLLDFVHVFHDYITLKCVVASKLISIGPPTVFFQDSKLKVSKVLTRVKDQYRYSSTVSISSTEFNAIEDLCNFLIEKLDSSVIIGESRLSHSQEHLERARYVKPETCAYSTSVY